MHVVSRTTSPCGQAHKLGAMARHLRAQERRRTSRRSRQRTRNRRRHDRSHRHHGPGGLVADRLRVVDHGTHVRMDARRRCSVERGDPGERSSLDSRRSRGLQASSHSSMRRIAAHAPSCFGRRRKVQTRPSVNSPRGAKRWCAGWAGRSGLRISTRRRSSRYSQAYTPSRVGERCGCNRGPHRCPPSSSVQTDRPETERSAPRCRNGVEGVAHARDRSVPQLRQPDAVPAADIRQGLIDSHRVSEVVMHVAFRRHSYSTGP